LEERNRALKIILLLAGLFFVMVLVFAYFTMRAIKDTDDAMAAFSKNSNIAVVEITGVIMESKKSIEKLHRAEKADGIKAIIVRVDSPGGAVGPTQEIYQEILRIDEKIPVYASFGSIAASGGYYIGAAARKIFVSKGSLTGSIGVIMQFMELTDLYEFVKIKPSIIKAGKYKDIGNPSRAMTAEEKEILQDTMSAVHKQFKDDILFRRKELLKVPIDQVAQGQIFSGEEALKYGLVDTLAGLWEAGRIIHKELGLKGEFQEFKYIKDKKKFSILDLAESLEEVVSFIREPSVIFSKISTPHLMFLAQ
jgi:protease-4